MTVPEFHRPERLDAIGEASRTVAVAATTDECAALARRFGLAEVAALSGTFAVRRDAQAILATGHVTARVVQSCVATGDPVSATIDETVTLRFVPELASDADELEIDAQDCDVIAYDGNNIDLGEAAAETMALALDPFPRCPGSDEILRAAGVVREEDARPVGALESLRDRLEGKA